MNISSLIAQSIYESGLNDRQSDKVVSSNYVEYALFVLPLILDEYRDKIPFAQQFEGLTYNDLFSTDFYQVSNVDLVINNVSSPLVRLTLEQWNETRQITNNFTGVPQCFYFNELPRDILVYPIPTSGMDYSFIVWGRKADFAVALTDIIPAQITPLMINTLIYKLANELCIQYGVPWPDEKAKRLDILERKLADRKAIDLTPQRDNVFGYPNLSKVAPFPYFFAMSGGFGS